MKNWGDKAFCPLVQDLLPSLADGITKPETEEALREHMKTCTQCRELFADMCPAEEEAAPQEEIPVEEFIRKQKRLKKTVTVLIAVLFLILLGITLFIASLIPEPPETEELSIRGTGFVLGENSGAVDVAISGELRIYPKDPADNNREYLGDIGVLAWDTFTVTDAAGEPLFDSLPYQYSLPAWLPLQEDDAIESLLGVYNERDMSDYTHIGHLYARRKLTDFILYDLTADGGYVLCYPSRTKEEAERMLYQYMQEFDLGGQTESLLNRILSE